MSKTIPWTEKYRPKKINDLVIPKRTLNKINEIIKSKEMPNMIITGSPGIGKTTTIKCITRGLLGKYCSQGVLELNASDDRGVKTVQNTIINFCKKKFDIEYKKGEKSYAKHKIILLDEGDNMTKKAQQLINNLMEKYQNTRFAFTCNNSSDIIEAIQSRCIILKYVKLTREQIIGRLEYICKKENIEFTKRGLSAIVVISQGDMRKAINDLQLTYNGYKKITEKHVYMLCDEPHPMIIKQILLECNKNNLKGSLTYLCQLRNNGYSSSDISLSMVDTLKLMKIPEISDGKKIAFLNEIGKTALNIGKGVDTPLQLSGCVAKMCYL